MLSTVSIFKLFYYKSKYDWTLNLYTNSYRYEHNRESRSKYIPILHF